MNLEFVKSPIGGTKQSQEHKSNIFKRNLDNLVSQF